MVTNRNIILYLTHDILSRLYIFKDDTSGDNILPWQEETYKKIYSKTKTYEEATVIKIKSTINKINPQSASSIEKELKKIKDILAAHGEKVSPLSAEAVYDVSTKYYKKVKRNWSERFDYPYSFITPDEVAIERVNKFQHIFIGKHYKDDVTKEVHNIIKKTIQEEKGALSRDQVAAKLKKLMPGYVKQRGYYDVVAGQVLNNARSYSSMRFYSEAEILKYEVLAVMDDRTSDQCKFMNGQELNVEKTLERYNLYDEATSIDDVKEVVPWLTTEKFFGETFVLRGKTILTPDMTGEELQALGVNAPPYHGRCRSDVAPLF